MGGARWLLGAPGQETPPTPTGAPVGVQLGVRAVLLPLENSVNGPVPLNQPYPLPDLPSSTFPIHSPCISHSPGLVSPVLTEVGPRGTERQGTTGRHSAPGGEKPSLSSPNASQPSAKL